MRRAQDALLGSILPGGYRVHQRLGSGATGHVYAAERAAPSGESGRIALKVLRSEHAGRAELLGRFQREAVAASSIDHENVLRVHAIGELPTGLPYFTMELLIGLDLADALSAVGSFSPQRAAAVADGIAAALEASHRVGIIHRDVRPENVFLEHAPDGREIVKLLDFGLAWMEGDPSTSVPSRPPGGPVSTGTPVPRGVGSPEYTAPEELVGAGASPAADIYSLSVVLHEMLTGRLPEVSRVPSSARRVTSEKLVPAAFESVLAKALAVDPAARFGSMSELRAAIAAAARLGPAS